MDYTTEYSEKSVHPSFNHSSFSSSSSSSSSSSVTSSSSSSSSSLTISNNKPSSNAGLRSSSLPSKGFSMGVDHGIRQQPAPHPYSKAGMNQAETLKKKLGGGDNHIMTAMGGIGITIGGGGGGKMNGSSSEAFDPSVIQPQRLSPQLSHYIPSKYGDYWSHAD